MCVAQHANRATADAATYVGGGCSADRANKVHDSHGMNDIYPTATKKPIVWISPSAGTAWPVQ